MKTTGVKVTLLALVVSYSCALQAKNVSLGDTAVATGQRSTAVGEGSMALGNNMTAEQAQAAMKAQNALLQNRAQAHEQYTQTQALFDSNSLANSNILERQEAMKPLLQQQETLAGQRTAQQQQVTQAQQAADRMAQIYERNLGAVSQIVDENFVALWQQGQADRLAQEVKKRVEQDTSVSNDTPFYVSYVNAYIEAKTRSALVNETIKEKTGSQIKTNYQGVALSPVLSAGNSDKAMLWSDAVTDNDQKQLLSRLHLNTAALKGVAGYQEELAKIALITSADGKKNLYQAYQKNARQQIEQGLTGVTEAGKQILSELYLDNIDEGTFNQMVSDIFTRYENQLNYLIPLDKVNSLSPDSPDYAEELQQLLVLESSPRDNAVGLNTNPDALKQKVDQYLQDNALSHTQAMSSQATQLKQAEYQAADKALNEAQSTLSQGKQAVAVGDKSLALGEKSVALGVDARALAKNSVALGDGSLADRDNSVSVGREGQERFLTHVAAGIAKTDAVNKGQLDEERDARIAGDKQTLKQAMDYTDVSIQYSEAKTNKRITEEQQARIEGDEQTLAAANRYTDETFGQVTHTVLDNARQYTDQRFSQLDNKISQVEKRANAGIAGVTAISSIPYVNSERFSFGMAMGHYRDAQAIATGVQYKPTANTNVRLNASWNNGGDTSIGAGFAVGW
ncbi:TPA: YadA-like family protein [Providencia stuartii]|uniref:YadA family autotransporter adhesin n=1 Tax=Providencia stuartii TaxID=588 RepID=UPI00197EF85D|nr:YadA-like family protein [Providencia stuartii]HEK2629963.1 YadA-like family protein [Proteus mirabilis]MBN5592172.1 YadA-like family protein [Providencia stuartii]WAZ77928.1 YadA-like family protein [Providencia stuartii]WAZ80932.1 YadA-like family protein [Providencia stuartii]HEM7153634.1 YadA-like family protein [Providencia stuartii]